jgi:hypothetical protein
MLLSVLRVLKRSLEGLRLMGKGLEVSLRESKTFERSRRRAYVA